MTQLCKHVCISLLRALDQIRSKLRKTKCETQLQGSWAIRSKYLNNLADSPIFTDILVIISMKINLISYNLSLIGFSYSIYNKYSLSYCIKKRNIRMLSISSSHDLIEKCFKY